MQSTTFATNFDAATARGRAASALLWLAALTLATRLPYFFVGNVDWDESTFILMGHSIVDGYLPYEQLWDNKPPLLFALFAVLATLPGDPLLAVRVFGALCVIATALLVHRLARELGGARAATIAAVLYVLGAASSGSGQATTSELTSTLPLLAAVTLLATGSRRGIATYAAAGALLAIAALIRLNLGIVALAIGVWIAAIEWRGGARHVAAALGAYAAAGIAVLVACALPYAFTGTLELFWNSVFGAPLRYATSRAGLLDSLLQHARNAIEIRIADPGRFAFGWIGWVASVAGVALVARHFRGWRAERRAAAVLVCVAAFAAGVSILMTGTALLHYLLALVPFVAVFAGVAYAALARRSQTAVAAVIAVLGTATFLQVADEYLGLARRLSGGERLIRGEAYEIADYLRPRCGQGCSVYLLNDQLAYVLLDSYPPRKIVTHPSNIAKRSLLRADIGTAPTPLLEMRALLEQRPRYIVKRDEVTYLEPEQRTLLAATLERDYEIDAQLGDRRVYRAKAE